MTTLFIDWQPDEIAFTIGGFMEVRWYSLMWVTGLLAAYLIVQRLYKQQKIADELFDPLFFYCFFGVLIGARLGHCIFYEPERFLTSTQGIVQMLLPIHIDASGDWHFTGFAGLASHGGTVGLFLALMLYCRNNKMNGWVVLDNIAVAAPFTSCFIRLGNLMNSEIIGNVTDVPWAFIFHTNEAMVDGHAAPRHPAQLYEAIAYLIIGIVGAIIYYRWYKMKKDAQTDSTGMFSSENKAAQQVAVAAADSAVTRIGSGFYFGYCLATIFVFRFFVEFIKKEQVDFEQDMMLDMGQLLSIPIALVGIGCMVRSYVKNKKK